nr:asparagine synthase-related protein [Kibdelosporangium phytohabitans]
MFPTPPPALTRDPLWTSVSAVPEDHCLLLDRDGRARTRRWWWPPEPVLPLEQGAPLLREALIAAVRARTRSGRTVSADLSGGLDSTTMCALAAADVDPLVAFTVASLDPADDDGVWADIAAAELSTMHRLVVTDEDLPTPYEDILRPDVAREDPHPGSHVRAEDKAKARLLAAHGSRLHLTGDGGDEVLQAATFSYLPELLRSQPRTGYRHLRGMRALHRWSWPTTWRLLNAPRDERSELLACARALTAPDRCLPSAVWLPPWATATAVDAARDLLIRTAHDTPPHTASKARRDIVQVVRHSGRMIRRSALAAAADGLPMAAPFLDDRVVEACLAVRIHERTTPWRYKPLLVEAMRGIVPARCLTRTTKGGTTPEYEALPRYRSTLQTFWHEARLAELGLIDLDRLRSGLTGGWATDEVPIMLESTVGCERWLRDLQCPVLPTTPLTTGAPR